MNCFAHASCYDVMFVRFTAQAPDMESVSRMLQTEPRSDNSKTAMASSSSSAQSRPSRPSSTAQNTGKTAKVARNSVHPVRPVLRKTQVLKLS